MIRRASHQTGIWMRALASARRRAANKDGMAAVEFALLLPLLITLFFGVVETSMALLCRADVSIMASTAADLISQASTLSSGDLTNTYSASGTILYPYYDGSAASPKPAIRITSVNYDPVTQSTTSGKVGWTCVQAGSGSLSPAVRNVGDVVTFGPPLIPSSQALMTTNGSVTHDRIKSALPS